MSGLSFASNQLSIKAQTQLGRASDELSAIYERLSSGLRINKASDDPAGLAIVSGLLSDRQVYGQGIRNLNDGISLLNVAEGALNELTSIVIRIQELAEQSANGSLAVSQRKALNTEAQSLAEEYFRIARTTDFNNKSLFTSDFGTLTLQAGYGSSGSIQSNLGGAIGTGTFHGQTSYSTGGGYAHDVALADFNGDGILDLASVGSNASNDGYVNIRLGLGGGSFGTQISYAADTNGSIGIAIGDINGDGKMDIVTGGQSDSTTGSAFVLIGNGDGTFATAVSYTTETTYSNSVALGDVNGDGHLDLVTAGLGGGGRATVRLGNGDGTFASGTSYLMISSFSNAVSLADLNGDGILDLVAAGQGGGSGRLGVSLGNGDGTFGTVTTYTTESGSSTGLRIGDLNGDGVLDLVTSGNGGVVTFRLGVGDGTFGTSTSVSLSTTQQDVELADINGDGILDLIGSGTTVSAVITIRLGTGSGTFQGAYSYAMSGTSTLGIASGDINNDGIFDIATGGYGAGPAGVISVILGGVTSGVGPLLPFSLATQADALQAIPKLEGSLTRLTVQRGVVGAFQSRLNHATTLLAVTTENLAAAAGRIRDADIAKETADLVKGQIRQQAATAILAQANLQGEVVLGLLNGV